jgi:surfactin synthase thioesterase subunit
LSRPPVTRAGRRSLGDAVPGRQNRRFEPHAGSITELVDGLVKQMEPYLDRPFSILGESMSAAASRLERDTITLRQYVRFGTSRPVLS